MQPHSCTTPSDVRLCLCLDDFLVSSSTLLEKVRTHHWLSRESGVYLHEKIIIIKNPTLPIFDKDMYNCKTRNRWSRCHSITICYSALSPCDTSVSEFFFFLVRIIPKNVRDDPVLRKSSKGSSRRATSSTLSAVLNGRREWFAAWPLGLTFLKGR